MRLIGKLTKSGLKQRKKEGSDQCIRKTKKVLRVKSEREVVVAFAKEKPNAFVGKKTKKKNSTDSSKHAYKVLRRLLEGNYAGKDKTAGCVFHQVAVKYSSISLTTRY